MSAALQIGLIGDRNEEILAHRAIPPAVSCAADALGLSVQLHWLATDELEFGLELGALQGLWAVPGRPYRSLAGALRGIGFARERPLPFLGTCGGFQHALIEYARSCLGWSDAAHAEVQPQAERALVTALECSLVEVSAPVRLRPGSRIRAAYASDTATEGYHCRYGLNPAYQERLLAGPLRASAHDVDGAVRAVELDAHPFFVATLFQPERAGLSGRAPPLVRAFLATCEQHRAGP